MNDFVKVTKEFIVKDSEGYRLEVKMWKCSMPENFNAINFVQTTKGLNGEIDNQSIYEFFLSDDEVKVLAEGLAK